MIAAMGGQRVIENWTRVPAEAPSPRSARSKSRYVTAIDGEALALP